MKRPSRNIKSTARRSFHDGGHRPPMDGVDHCGNPWKGTSRVIDRPARRRAMKRTWAADVAKGRMS